MKYFFKYKYDLVIKFYIIMVFGLVWICVLIILNINKDFGVVIFLEVFIYVVMYKEVCNEIKSNYIMQSILSELGYGERIKIVIFLVFYIKVYYFYDNY